MDKIKELTDISKSIDEHRIELQANEMHPRHGEDLLELAMHFRGVAREDYVMELSVSDAIQLAIGTELSWWKIREVKTKTNEIT